MIGSIAANIFKQKQSRETNENFMYDFRKSPNNISNTGNNRSSNSANRSSVINYQQRDTEVSSIF
jgi:hypothetical protein